jgi:chemotaxis protein CheX
MLKQQTDPTLNKRAAIIEPFITAAAQTIQMMSSLNVSVLSREDSQTDIAWQGILSGVIGFTGEKLNGCLVLRFDRPSILSIVSGMFMEEIPEVTSEVVDAVGELTNIVLGNAKGGLHDLGYELGMAQPIVVQGDNVYLHQVNDTPPAVIRMSVPQGIFLLELSFKL